MCLNPYCLQKFMMNEQNYTYWGGGGEGWRWGNGKEYHPFITIPALILRAQC